MEPLHPDNRAVKFLQKAADSIDLPVKVESGDIFVRKMKTFVHRMDMDGDGLLTKRDFELLAERYAEKGKLDPVRAKQGLKQLQSAWDLVFSPEAVDGKITPERMTEALLRRGRDMIIALAAVCFAFVFDVVDTEGAGVISRENFRLFHKVSNIERKDITDQAFDILDEDKNGVLNFMEFVQAGIDYFLSNDEKSPYNILYGPLLA